MIYVVITLGLIALDQVAKFIVRKFLIGAGSVSFVKYVMDFVYVENRGAAFGIMQDTRWFLVAITFVVLAALLIYVIKNKSKTPLFLIASSLIFAGGIGNLIDRIAFGYVTDFLHFLFIDFPCFNIADICVCVGGALMVIYILFSETVRGETDER